MALREDDPNRSLKERVLGALREARPRLIELASELWRTPELGFKEYRTAARVAAFLEGLGLEVRTGLALTGVKAVAPGGRWGDVATAPPGLPVTPGPLGRPATPRPCVAVLGELDAVTCPGHPDADPLTGAAHACGHHAQVVVMLGVAQALVESGVLEDLGGAVAFMAVPAEEYVEIEYRLRLREEGKVEFLAGKPELIRLGEFDDVDMAILVHAGGLDDERLTVGGTSNGFVGRFIRYVGREAHAGAAPWQGANALSAALVGLTAINALRETFNDEDCIRVHPIITRGGDLVNIIPADVRLETYVRGRTVEAIRDAAGKVDRALRAGAMAIGTQVEIQSLPGFLPMRTDAALEALFRRSLDDLVGPAGYVVGGHMGGSTDMGDLSHVLPALHPYGAGVTGRPHAPDYRVVDPELAYFVPAEAVALTVVDLLADGAREAREVLAAGKPPMDRDAYVTFARSLFERTVYPG
ncbi:MAG: M20/M25/M40 family metallo-hydrolase [Firmicutes bacterium]|nr:M20/M25/M40 family metallo-hydrolase [Bacillota bacterium]